MFDLVSYIRDLRSHNYLHMNQPPPFLVEYAIGTQQLSLSSSLSNYMHMLDDDITSLIGLVCEAVLYGKQFHISLGCSTNPVASQGCTASSSWRL